MEPDRDCDVIVSAISVFAVVLIAFTGFVLIAENHPSLAHLLPECRPVRTP